jgi:hypothetical protein
MFAALDYLGPKRGDSREPQGSITLDSPGVSSGQILLILATAHIGACKQLCGPARDTQSTPI